MNSAETKSITINISPYAARAYESALPEDRRKFDVLLSLKLAEFAQEKWSLEDIMQEISRKAQKRGLTPEILA